MDKKIILLVDNHVLVRDSLSAYLMICFPEKINVVEASSGHEALELLKRKINPDLILMDINMPGLNGFETCKIITKDFPLIKVIILSLNNDRYYAEYATECGAISFINKSDELDKLILEIEKHLVQ
ncbi:MAG: response regulator transcription factor [Bacteroidota bacterium]